MTTRICFIRHGQTDWNVARRIQGQLDVPLNQTGRAQALAMAFNAAHQRFAALYSSDLARARETALALAQREDLPVRPLPALRERHFGILQGLTVAEAAARHPQAFARYQAREVGYDLDTGESLSALAARVAEAVDWMVRHHAGQSVCAVTHSGVLDVLYRRATGRALHTARDFQIPNCALNWLQFDAHGWHLEQWGDRHHLSVLTGQGPE